MESVDYLQSLETLQITGVLGFITYLLAFGAVQCGWMDGNGLGYTLGNMLAAALVGVSLLAEFNLSSALIQSSYLIIGLVGIMRWSAIRMRATSVAPSGGAK